MPVMWYAKSAGSKILPEMRQPAPNLRPKRVTVKTKKGTDGKDGGLRQGLPATG
jgi:hypothetical protein